MSGADCRFKVSTAVGDTFTDAAVSDVLLNAINGPTGRAILAGFTVTGSSGPSALRITPSAVTVLGNLSCTAISAGNVGLFRNRIINGDMRIDQRNGGSPTTSTTSAATYLADRFNLVSSTGSMTLQQLANPQYAAMGTSVGVFFPSMISATVATAATAVSTDSVSISQHIEGMNISDFGWGTAGALPIIVSFYVASNISGQYSASLRGNGQCAAMSFTVTGGTSGVMGSWQRIVLAFPGNTQSGWVSDNTSALALDITLLIGSGGYVTASGVWQTGSATAVAGQSNLMATVGNAIYLTGIQLEKATLVTPFEFRPYTTELQMCQRYYTSFRTAKTSSSSITTYGPAHSTSSTGNVRALITLPTQMRANPSLVITEGITSVGGAGLTLSGNTTNDSFYLFIGGVNYAVSGTVSFSDLPVPNNSPTLVKLAFTSCVNGSASPSAGLAGELNSAATSGKTIAFNAEI